MTIASQTSRISYTGDGSTTAFAVPFFFQANADLVVSVQDLSGNVTTKALGSDYNLTGATLSAGGTCTFTTAPTAGFILAIYRVPQITQTTSYNNNDPFPAKSHELALDKTATIDQYLKSLIDRAILVAPTDTPPMTTLPPASVRALKALTFDSLGNPSVSTPVTGTTVSSTMIPVVSASTLAIARALLGIAYFDTQTLAAAASIPSSLQSVFTGGFAAAGDGGAALYRKVGSAPSHAGKFQSADGAWWEVRADSGKLYPEMFSSTANTSAIQTAVDVANAIGAGTVQLSGKSYAAVKQGANSWCLNLSGPVSLIGPAASTRDGVTAGTGCFITWDSSINTSTDILRWSTLVPLQNTRVSGIGFFPAGFTANSADVSGLTKYGRHAIDVTSFAGAFMNCAIDNCIVGPTNSGYSIFFGGVGDWIDGRVYDNQIWGGVNGSQLGDNCSFTNNSCFGIKPAFEVGNQPGAATLKIEHNHGIPAGGGVVLRSGLKAVVNHNFFELVTAHTGSGYMFDFNGLDGTLTDCEFKHNVAGCTGVFGLTGLVRLDNTTKLDMDANRLSNVDPALTYPIRITANNANPYCGQASVAGTYISQSAYNPAYYLDAAGSAQPIGIDVELTMANSWTTTATFETPRVRRLRDGTCVISGDISSGTTTSGTLFATVPCPSFFPKHTCIRSGPNSGGGVVNFSIASSSGQMLFRSTGDATATGISCTYQGVGIT